MRLKKIAKIGKIFRNSLEKDHFFLFYQGNLLKPPYAFP